jgi:hypothetical protein
VVEEGRRISENTMRKDLLSICVYIRKYFEIFLARMDDQEEK